MLHNIFCNFCVIYLNAEWNQGMEERTMVKLVAFDLDGTLSRSDLFLLPAYREALSRLGAAPLGDERLLALIGGSYESNREALGDRLTPEGYAQFSEIVGDLAPDYAARYGSAYPNVAESLAALRRAGYLPVLCTNGSQRYAEGVLRAEGIRELFGELFPGRTDWHKGQVLRQLIVDHGAAAAVMVGDRHFDREAARFNGVPFVGCLYGLFPEEVRGADAVVADPCELPAAVERLMEPQLRKKRGA